MQIVPFTELHTTDLSIDKVYRGGRAGNAGDDPLTRLLKVSAGGGFRYRGTVDALEILVLTSTLKEPDWPDTLDRETGIYTYYGDNKSPGRSLHETPRKGNELLRRVFDLAHAGVEGRRRVPRSFSSKVQASGEMSSFSGWQFQEQPTFGPQRTWWQFGKYRKANAFRIIGPDSQFSTRV